MRPMGERTVAALRVLPAGAVTAARELVDLQSAISHQVAAAAESAAGVPPWVRKARGAEPTRGGSGRASCRSTRDATERAARSRGADAAVIAVGRPRRRVRGTALYRESVHVRSSR